MRPSISEDDVSRRRLSDSPWLGQQAGVEPTRAVAPGQTGSRSDEAYDPWRAGVVMALGGGRGTAMPAPPEERWPGTAASGR